MVRHAGYMLLAASDCQIQTHPTVPFANCACRLSSAISFGSSAAGELNFIVIGVILQMCSICTESTRLVLVQILLQRRGLKLNPITTLYYIAPCCFGFLLLPFALLEAPKIMNDPSVVFRPFVFVTNAAAAFGKHSFLQQLCICALR